MAERWPELPLAEWQDTYTTLHMWTQVVGKIALARMPPVNHSWGVALQLTPRGLSTLALPYGERSFSVEFDFIDHHLLIRTSDGERRGIELRSQTVAGFYTEVMRLLDQLSLPVKIWPMAVETPAPIRLDQDTTHHSYDREFVGRLWRVLHAIAPVLTGTRCSFVGKCSPVHFFWGSFDLAVTRFSGRPAPPRDGPAFMREAYSHEVISHGFWPGGAPVLEPAFYAYAAPEPEGLKLVRPKPEAAYYHAQLGEFILPYEAVRTSASPEQAIRDFVGSTYEGAARLAKWDRSTLER